MMDPPRETYDQIPKFYPLQVLYPHFGYLAISMYLWLFAVFHSQCDQSMQCFFAKAGTYVFFSIEMPYSKQWIYLMAAAFA